MDRDDRDDRGDRHDGDDGDGEPPSRGYLAPVRDCDYRDQSTNHYLGVPPYGSGESSELPKWLWARMARWPQTVTRDASGVIRHSDASNYDYSDSERMPAQSLVTHRYPLAPKKPHPEGKPSVPNPPPQPPPMWAQGVHGHDNHDITNMNLHSRTSPRPGLFQTVLDNNHDQDVTVHLELPIHDDLDDDLEEFSRLKRMGDFRAAKNFFDGCLREHHDHPYVFVQYAEMLLAMGDYGAFESLNPHAVFKIPNRGPPQPYLYLGLLESSGSKELDLLRLNWDLMEAVSTMRLKGYMADEVFHTALRALESLSFTSETGSTEINILLLSVEILAYARLKHVRTLDIILFQQVHNWPTLYQLLLTQGRVWDVRDVFEALIRTCNKLTTAMFTLYGDWEYTPRIVGDWVNSDGDLDESTTLALLDIHLLALMAPMTPLEQMEAWLRGAQPLADILTTRYPEYTRSRSFARWIATKAAEPRLREVFSRYAQTGLSLSGLEGFPGSFSWWGGVMPIPVYVPATVENPFWQVPEGPPQTKEPLTMALKLSRQLHDYSTEKFCLQLLIMNSQDPAGHFEELCRLQNTMKKDRFNYLWTCLSRFLVCKDDKDRKTLLQDLDSFPDWLNPNFTFDPFAYWARDYIRAALSAKLGISYDWEFAGRSARIYRQYLQGDRRYTQESSLATPLEAEPRARRRSNPELERSRERGNERQRRPTTTYREKETDGAYKTAWSVVTQKTTEEGPWTGETRIPAGWISKRALAELGYQYRDEGNIIVVPKGLSHNNFNELLEVSDGYEERRRGVDGRALTVIRVEAERGDGGAALSSSRKGKESLPKLTEQTDLDGTLSQKATVTDVSDQGETD